MIISGVIIFVIVLAIFLIMGVREDRGK